jgi:hypothetical protein
VSLFTNSSAGYNKWGYTAEGWIIYKPPAVALTTDQPFNSKYGRLLKAKFEVWDKDEDNLLLNYNMFDPGDSTFVPSGLRVTRGLQNNEFTLTFADGEKFLDASDIRYGTKIKIWAGKADNTSELLPLFLGYASGRTREGLGPGVRNYYINGVGEQAAVNKYVASLQRASTKLQTGPNVPRLPDEQMTVANLFRELFTKTDVRVGGGDSIADILNLDVSGIDDRVDQYISSINEFSKVDAIANKLCELGGSNWRIEFGKLIMEYPKFLKPKFTIKSVVEQGDRSDDTSYILIDMPWNDNENTSSGEGHATTIYTNTNIDAKEVAGNNINQASMVLYNRIIFQAFDALDTRFNTLFLKLSRIGDPTNGDQDKMLRGQIRIDNNGLPTGPLVKEFEIPPGSVNDTADNIFVNEIGSSTLISPNGRYHILLYPIGNNFYNTIRWHHDNSRNRFDFPGSGWSVMSSPNQNINTLSWRRSERGPVYDFGIFAKINRLQRYDADTTIQLIGATEEIEQYPFLDDAVSTAKMMQNVLGFRSLIPRKFNYQITIPDKMLPLPGLYTNIVDDMLDASLADFITGEVQEVAYDWTTSGSEGPGILYCNARVLGFSDPLEDELV